MRKHSRKKRSKKRTNLAQDDDDDENQIPFISALSLKSLDADKKDEKIDISNYFENYKIHHKKSKEDSDDLFAGVKLTKTENQFFFIDNDILSDETKINDERITDVFGCKSDVGDISVTELSINGEKITLPTDLVNCFYPYSLSLYYGSQEFDE